MPERYSIIVVDDEPVMRDSCRQILLRKGCDVYVTVDGRSGLESLNRQDFDAVILDMRLPDISGIDMLKTIKALKPGLPVIIITGYPSVENAVQVMKMGAFDYIPKPFTPNILRDIVTKALRSSRDKIDSSSRAVSNGGLDAIVGKSNCIRDMKRFIQRAGMSDCSVLITGETGTGKELVARALHQCSRRRNNIFISIDSGGLVDTLVESELFGHVKGSFTSAFSDRVGKFEMAHKGTLFFDEIANMSHHVQSKLLRILQEQEFSRVGDSRIISVNVRILAATNRNLREAVDMGVFRTDLYYRLDVLSLHIPPLRERREDIPLLAEHFLRQFRTKYEGESPCTLSDRTIGELMGYDWPGNVRELKNVIERSAIFCNNSVLDDPDIMHSFAEPLSHGNGLNDSSANLEHVEKEHIRKVLDQCRNNKTKAAQVLGVDRKTLRTKIAKYRLS